MGVPTETEKVKVLEVSVGSPAESSGLAKEDWIVGVGQNQIKSGEELISAVAEFKGGKAELIVIGLGEEIKRVVEVEVRENPPEGEGSMGVAISTTEMLRVPWWQFYKGISAGFSEAYFWGKIIAGGMYQMVTGLFVGKVPQGVTGPVGMYQATSSIKNDQGILAMVHFFGIISVNLAILNFLPFPALDGGRMVFVAWEMITRKKANVKLEVMVNNVGMMVLLLLLLLVTLGDVARIFG
jgi:regulator of sigma E protease